MTIKKDKQIAIRLPEETLKEIKKQLPFDGLKTFQQLFDYLIVSGIVFRKPEVIDLIRKHKEKYRQISVQEKLSRLGKAPKLPTVKMKTTIAQLYRADFMAFKQFCLEESVTQANIFRILFIEGFLGRDEGLLKMINKAKELQVEKRTKTIARLTNDEYVFALDVDETKTILEELTANYDNRENFSEEIQQFIFQRMSEKDEDVVLEEELDRKLARLRKERTKKINKLIEEALDDTQLHE